MNDDNMTTADNQDANQEVPMSMAMNNHAKDGQAAAAAASIEADAAEDSAAAADAATMVDLDSVGAGETMQDLASAAANIGAMGGAAKAVDALENAVEDLSDAV